jgi:hypothetical protein
MMEASRVFLTHSGHVPLTVLILQALPPTRITPALGATSRSKASARRSSPYRWQQARALSFGTSLDRARCPQRARSQAAC